MIRRHSIAATGCVLLLGLTVLCGCGQSSDTKQSSVGMTKETLGQTIEASEMEKSNESSEEQESGLSEAQSNEHITGIDALGEPTGHLALAYAENFSVDYYDGGYKLLTVKDGTQILTVPEKKEIPEGLDESVIVLQQPINNIYLVSSAVMDMFRELDAFDAIGFSAQKAENWYVEGAKDAMENGDILYAGKYNSPDYELLVSKSVHLQSKTA